MSSIMMDTRAGSSTTASEDPCPGISSGSRKRSREADSPCCLGGCGNPQCSAKKSAVEVDSSPEHDPDRKISWWYVKLDSETENYDSDTPDSLKYESTWSIQGYETEVVQDSEDDLSDDETRWQQQHHLELELATDHSSEEGPFRRRGNCSSSSTTGSSDLEAVAVVAAAVTSEGFCAVEYYADSSSDSSDPELEPQDKWSCLKCKQKNQPIPRYCQQCFSVRKKWFPPRPRRRSRARRQAVREQAEQKGSTSFSEPSREVREVPGPSSMSMCETPYSPSRAGSFEFVPPTTSQPQDSLPSSPTSDRTAPDVKPETTSQVQQTLQKDIDDFLTVVKNFKPCDTETNSNPKPGPSTSPDQQQSKECNSPIHKPVATDSNTPQDSGINSLNESFDSQADTIILSRSSSSDEDVADMSCFSAVSRKSVSHTSEKHSDQQPESDEDVVDFPTNRMSRKAETSSMDVAPSVNQQVETCHSDEDVVDFPNKLPLRNIEGSSTAVVSVKEQPETCFSDEDVVDFPMRSTKLPSSTFKEDSVKTGVSSYLKRACTTEIDEDVVDLPIKKATFSSVEDNADIPKQPTNICDGASPRNDKETVDLPTNLSNKSSFHSDIDMPCSSPAHDAKLEIIKQDDTPSTSSPQSMPSHSSQSPSSQTSDTKMCIVCESREANTAFTHSKVAHLCVCYSCAKKIYNTKGQCPICRRAASSFYKVITI